MQYEYKCSDCGFITIQTHSIHEGIPSEIPCSGEACTGTAWRKFSVPAIHFKGKGFYTTDNKRDIKPSVSGDTKPDSPAPTTDTSDLKVDKPVDKKEST